MRCGSRLWTAPNPGERLVAGAASHSAMTEISRAVAARFPGYFPVRVVSFNKSKAANWRVPWHQDRVIAVENKACDVPGFKNWSLKGGIWHCEPPEQILAQMLFVRVFLDVCTAANGGMVFAVGSHRGGLQQANRAAEYAAQFPTETEEAQSGDILVLPMLTLHRSGDAVAEQSRRIFRIDFAATALPTPLTWFEQPLS